MIYRDRRDAGRQLARELVQFRDENPIVLGLPRGGVVVAAEIARALSAPLDVWLVRKLPAPENPEVSIGAVAEDGTVLVDDRLVSWLEIPRQDVQWVIEREAGELMLKRQRYRGHRGPPSVAGRTVILVDDGIATGSTARAAIASLRQAGPRRLVLAAPVALHEVAESLRPKVDALVCPHEPTRLRSVSGFYDEFDPVSDDEVLSLLRPNRDATDVPLTAFGVARPGRSTVQVWSGGLPLEGVVEVPRNARGVVLLVNGGGDGRIGPEEEAVASELNHARFATLSLDLLTEGERARVPEPGGLLSDVELVARRIAGAVEWLEGEPLLTQLPLGLLASGVAAPAAIRASTEGLATPARAIVVRDAPLGAAEPVLEDVHTPVLAVVSLGADTALLEDARLIEQIPAQRALATLDALGVPSAALTARLAIDWFSRYLRPPVASEAQV